VTWAFINIVLLLITQFVVMIYVWRLLPRWVFYILVPYTGWLCFASILNYLSLFNIKKCMKYIKKN
jgi:tryptophan-rich sensory protein